MVRKPIAIVTKPTAPCRPWLAQVSQRAESASGIAITVDKSSHPDHRADPEQRDVAEPNRNARRLRYRQHQQRGRTGHAVHQTDQERTPAKAVRMAMGRSIMRDGLAGMAMGVQMDGSVLVAMSVKMNPVAPQPPQHMRAETDQHDPDRGLDRARKVVGDGMAERQRSAGKYEQRQRMAEPPGQAMLDDVGDIVTARGDRGNRRHMIGLQRVLHAQQKTQSQYCKHTPPFAGDPPKRNSGT